MKKDTQLNLSNLPFTTLVKVACLLAVAYFVVRCIDSQDEDDITIQPTPVVIESVKPIGELYAYTAITEDYTIDNVEKVGSSRASTTRLCRPCACR